MQWETVASRNWMNYYQAAQAYYEKHGDLTVTIKYQTDQGLALGAWLSSQRYAFKKEKLPTLQ